MDWKETLGKLRENAELPAGEDVEVPAEESPRKVADTLHVVVEKKGRGGKTATIVEGFSCDDTELATIAAKLKRQLGVGGSARGGEILIQGNLGDKVRALLREAGYKVK